MWHKIRLCDPTAPSDTGLDDDDDAFASSA
jgi:hypothetical protein